MDAPETSWTMPATYPPVESVQVTVVIPEGIFFLYHIEISLSQVAPSAFPLPNLIHPVTPSILSDTVWFRCPPSAEPKHTINKFPAVGDTVTATLDPKSTFFQAFSTARPPPLGLAEGLALGEADGDFEGLTDGEGDGDTDGDRERDTEGDTEGDTDGLLDGDTDALGEREGDLEGETDGLTEGDADGDREGEGDGLTDGEPEGLTDGDTDADGDSEGLMLGETDGDGLGDIEGDIDGDILADADDRLAFSPVSTTNHWAVPFFLYSNLN